MVATEMAEEDAREATEPDDRDAEDPTAPDTETKAPTQVPIREGYVQA